MKRNDPIVLTETYLTSEEAAALLGVSRTSLYAYVSRGKIRTAPIAGRRERLYWREDVERLARQPLTPADSDPGPGLFRTTAITLITPEGQFYRGRSSIEMAETETLEATAAHLWQVDEATTFGPPPSSAPPGLPAALGALTALKIVDRAISVFPLIEMYSPRSYDLTQRGFAATGANIMRWYAALLVGDVEPTDEPIHAYLARKMNAPPGYDDLLRRMLVLFADHELAAPTYAVRAAANAGVTPFQAVIAGLNASRGRRVTSGRVFGVRTLLEEILESTDPAEPIHRRYRDGESLPGFGGELYGGSDPRSTAILDAIERQQGDDPVVRKVLTAIKAACDLYETHVDFVFPFCFVSRQLGTSINDDGIALSSRIAGWIAHASEQYHAGGMIRVAAAYVGPLPSSQKV